MTDCNHKWEIVWISNGGGMCECDKCGAVSVVEGPDK